jgi:hypothetical protein
MAAYARYAALGVLRSPPLRAGGAAVLFVAFQANLGLVRGRELLEVEDQAGFLAAGHHVAAGRPVARFAGLTLVNPLVHVRRERRGIGAVAGRAKLVVVDVFRARDLRDGAADLSV